MSRGPWRPKCAVIYVITCFPTGDRYIGCTELKLNIRWSKHKDALRNGRCTSRRLQAVWNEYGESAFDIRIIETCLVEQKWDREQWYFDNWKPELNGTLDTKNVESLTCARSKSPFGPGYYPQHRVGVKDSDDTKRRRAASVMATRSKMGKQRWITNGVVETAIYGTALPPTGWWYGRKPKIGAVARSRKGETRSDEAKEKMRKAHLGVKLVNGHWVKM